MNDKLNFLFIDDSKIDNYYTSCLIEMENLPIKAKFMAHPAKVLEYLRQVAPNQFPDALIIDVNMPVMSGFELAEMYLLEFYMRYPNTPVFIISSSPKMAMQDELADNPVITGFLPKPFTKETFETKISPHLMTLNRLESALQQ